ncbi:hypothetical protein NL298_26490, partial [Klebsiella pneumoniae]|nr:hypothetical protein [Klebsiella pneumoniae]
LGLGDVLDFDLRLHLPQTGGRDEMLPIVWLPESIETNGRFAPDTLEAQLQTLAIRAQTYQLDASGEANLGNQGHVDLTADMESRDLAALTGMA